MNPLARIVYNMVAEGAEAGAKASADDMLRAAGMIAEEAVPAPRPMTLGEGLTKGRGFTPREGDIDIQDALRKLEYDEDIQASYVDDYAAETIREYMERYFPEDEYDWNAPAMGLERAFSKATPEYLAQNEVPDLDIKQFYSSLASDMDNATTRAWDELDYEPYLMEIENLDDVQEAYDALNDIGYRLSNLPEDNPLRQAIGRIPESADYFNDVGVVVNNLEALRELQSAGVNREIITRVLNNIDLSRLFGSATDVPELFQKLTPAQAESFVRALPGLSDYISGRKKVSNITAPVSFLRQAASIDDEVLRDTYLGILPEWEGTPAEAFETARMLVDLGD
jgi:hypothetical protein